MRNVQIDCQGTDLTFSEASSLARNIALENGMPDPAILSWHQRSSDAMSPSYGGANPGSWWQKYGEGNGGYLEISVGNEYDFVMMDTREYETVDELPLRNLEDSSGNQFICISPMLGDASTPNEKACIPLDEWMANQY